MIVALEDLRLDRSGIRPRLLELLRRLVNVLGIELAEQQGELHAREETPRAPTTTSPLLRGLEQSQRGVLGDIAGTGTEVAPQDLVILAAEMRRHAKEQNAPQQGTGAIALTRCCRIIRGLRRDARHRIRERRVQRPRGDVHAADGVAHEEEVDSGIAIALRQGPGDPVDDEPDVLASRGEPRPVRQQQPVVGDDDGDAVPRREVVPDVGEDQVVGVLLLAALALDEAAAVAEDEHRLGCCCCCWCLERLCGSGGGDFFFGRVVDVERLSRVRAVLVRLALRGFDFPLALQEERFVGCEGRV